MTFDNEYSILCSCAVFLVEHFISHAEHLLMFLGIYWINWTRPCRKNKAHNVRGQLSCKNCWKSYDYNEGITINR